MSLQCTSCGAVNRDIARFCRQCGSSVRPGPPAGVAYDQMAARTPLPAPAARIPQVPPGTVVPERQRSAGTVLHSQQAELPLCAWLVVIRGRRKGRDFRLDQPVSTLGRDGSCDYVVEDETASRQHCRIRIENDRFVLFDLGSGNGTFVNGSPIQRVDLVDGDVITVGDTQLLFKDAKPRLTSDGSAVPGQPA